MVDSSEWLKSPEGWLLDEKAVHVWVVPLDRAADERQRFWQTLTEEEQGRANRFYFEHDKFHFIVARGVLRHLLGRYLTVLPAEIAFLYGHNGKPELAAQHRLNGRQLQFNLSHTKGMGLMGFSWNRVLGVDIERVRPLDDGPHIAKRFFSAWENDIFFNLPEAQYAQAFFNCWTRKEAFIKAIGDGLTYPLDRFDVTLAPGDKAQLLRIEGSKQKAEKWQLRSLTPAAGYVGALIAAGQDWHLEKYGWL